MTETDPAADVTANSQGPSGQSVNGADASPADATADDARKDQQTIERILNLPRDVGWMMMSVGVVGVILPGLPGTPFLLAAVAVLAPGGPQLLTRWAGRKPKGFVHAGLKQIGRWLDDLDRRYPRPPLAS
jgi:hypothetical protein